MVTEVLTKREAISERASAIAKDFKDVSTATKRVAADSVDALRQTANDFLDEGRTTVRKVGESVQGKVQEQPVKSMLIAAGVGFLVGVLFGAVRHFGHGHRESARGTFFCAAGSNRPSRRDHQAARGVTHSPSLAEAALGKRSLQPPASSFHRRIQCVKA